MYMRFSWLWVVSLLSTYVYILRPWVCGVWCSAMCGRKCSQGSWFFGGLVQRVMRTEDIIQPRGALYFRNTVFFYACNVMSIQCRYSYCCIVPPPPGPGPGPGPRPNAAVANISGASTEHASAGQLHHPGTGEELRFNAC
jgi:hypothetical protein